MDDNTDNSGVELRAANRTMTTPSTNKPNLLVIGAMKASTTSFSHLLRAHEEIWLPEEKEPSYFTSQSYEDQRSWNAYIKLFKYCAPDARYICEASTSYTKHPHLGPTPQRIREKLGQPKMIYLLRDPVSRTISNYRHSFVRGSYRAGMTLHEALQEDPIILTASRYHQQIQVYEDEFGPDCIHIVIAEAMHHDHGTVMEDVASYLEISMPSAWHQPLPVVNSYQQLQGNRGWPNWIMTFPGARRLKRIMPESMKHMLQSQAPYRAEAPPVTDDDRSAIFEAIEDDLALLMDRMGDSLCQWPSVQRLSESRKIT